MCPSQLNSQMKKIKLFNTILIGLLIFSSCQIDDEFNPTQYPQKWQLVKMTGQIANSETTGNAMEWQEFYLLNSNGTFTKSRERNGLLMEESGTFTFKNLSEEKFLELIYASDNELIGSCYSSELKESLWLKSENKLMGTWSECDGPGLEYERTE